MARPKPITFTNKAESTDSSVGVKDESTAAMKVVFRDAVDAGGVAELLLMDDIGESWDGEGITGKSVKEFLSGCTSKKLKVVLNSCGGSVIEGLSIYNSILAFDGETTTEITGLAGSIAAVIAVATDRVTMHEASMMMVHPASVGTFGNQYSHRSQLETLELIDKQILDVFEARCSVGREELEALFVGADFDGTWLNSETALKLGFVDEVIPMPVKDAPKNPETSASARGDRTITASITLPENYEIEDLVIRNTSLKKTESGETVSVVVDGDDVVPLEVSDDAKAMIVAAAKRRSSDLARMSSRMREENLKRYEKQLQTS